MSLGLTDKIQINKDIISKNVDGTVYIMDPRNGTIHTLNETASFIWSCFKKTNTIKEVAQQLNKQYQVNEKESIADVKEFVGKYLKQSLLEAV